MNVEVTINGERHSHDVEPRLLLVHYLRDVVGLTGTHVGCETSLCGACTVMLDGQAVKSCTLLAVTGERRRNHHHRRSGRERRTSPCTGRLLGVPWPAVRLLHARNDHRRPPAAGAQLAAHRGADPAQYRGQSLSLHRIPAHRGRRPARSQGNENLKGGLPCQSVNQLAPESSAGKIPG